MATMTPVVEVRLKLFGQGQHKVDIQRMAVAEKKSGGIQQHLTLALVFGFFGKVLNGIHITIKICQIPNEHD